MPNDISPVRQGQTDPPCHWQFKDSLGNVIAMPTGTTFTQYIYNPKTYVTQVGAGSFSVVDLSQGKVDYLWNAADTANAGDFEVFAGYVLPSGGQGYTDPVEFTVEPIFGQT